MSGDGHYDLQAELEADIVRHRVAGASAAFLHGGTLTIAAAGVTNVETGVEITPDTVMHIGSITKIFTTTLLMQLVDEGIVDLDEPVVRYLPDLSLKDLEALKRITVKMLLNHTSGIDGGWQPDYGHDEETIEKAVARYAELGQLFPPGEEWSYCNAAYVIAGYLAQRVTGASWYELIKKRILGPLQMKHAATLPEEALRYRAGVGHYLDATSKELTRTPFAFGPLSFAPAGSTLMMSAADLLKFADAHLRRGIGTTGASVISERSVAAMQAVTVDNGGKAYASNLNMGLGWMISEDGLLQHAGGGPGVASVLYVSPQGNWAAAILTNSAHGFRLTSELISRWLAVIGIDTKPIGTADIQIPSQQVQMDPDKYVGTYEDVLTRYWITRTPHGLAVAKRKKFLDCENASTDPTPPIGLIPLGNDRFMLELDENLPDPPPLITFRGPNPNGQMRYLAAGSLHLRVDD